MFRFSTSLATLFTALALTGSASAALPDGWAVTEGPRPSEDQAMLGCCGFDTRCCPAAQEEEIFVANVKDQAAVRALDELPLAQGQTTSFELGDEAGLRVFDGYGAPVARLDVRPAENWLQMVPRGVAGRIAVGKRETFWGSSAPFYDASEERHLGFGVKFTWSSSIPPVLPVMWQAVSHEGDTAHLQSVVGTLDRFAGTVESSEHIETSLAAVGRVFAYRTRRDGQERVHVLLPDGSLAYSDDHVDSSPLEDRFFHDAAFRDLSFPVDGRGASAGLDARFSSRHWALAMPGADPNFEGRIHISVTDGHIVVATTSS